MGFQLPGGAQNFVRLVRQRLGLETLRDRIRTPDGREVMARAYPISIDASSFNKLASTEEAAERAIEIRHDLGEPRLMFSAWIALITQRGSWSAFKPSASWSRRGRIDPDEAVMVQLAIPSRERVALYRQLKDDIDRLVGQINGDIPRIGRPPIIYLRVSYPRVEMAAFYRAADIMVVTPLRDGMNLVAKEYVACRQRDDGALVLSEFTGAARELRQGYLVNPHDIDGLKDRLVEAMNDSPQNKARRMKLMRRQVVENDIDKWADTFLDDLEEVDPDPGSKPSRLSPPGAGSLDNTSSSSAVPRSWDHMSRGPV